MEKCPVCGNDVPDNACFCGSCGGAVVKSELVESVTKVHQGHSYDENQGLIDISTKLLSDQAPISGDIRLQTSTYLNNQHQIKNSFSTGKRLALGLFLALLIIAGGFLGWKNFNTEARGQDKLDLAVKYLNENNFEQAILAYNEAIKIDPKQVKAYQGLARVYTLQGKYDDAKATYDGGLTAVAVNDRITLALGLAGMYVDKGQLPNAEKAFQELVNSDQNCLEAYLGLAIVYQNQGDSVKAEAVLRQAESKFPTDSRGYNNLALFLKQNNKSDDAFNNLVKSISIDFNQQEAYLVLSDLYKNNWDKLQAKLPGASDQQVSAMMEFYMYYASEDYAKAVNMFRTRLNGPSGNHKARILAAIAMFKFGDKTGAENLINQVVVNQLNSGLLSDLALYYQAAGDNKKAREYAIKALQDRATNLEAIALLQQLNTGDEKKYAAEFLLYNWKPVINVDGELNRSSIHLQDLFSGDKEMAALLVTTGVNVTNYQYRSPNGKEYYCYKNAFDRNQLPPNVRENAYYFYPLYGSRCWTVEQIKKANIYNSPNSIRMNRDYVITECEQPYWVYWIVFLDQNHNIIGLYKGEVDAFPVRDFHEIYNQ